MHFAVSVIVILFFGHIRCQVLVDDVGEGYVKPAILLGGYRPECQPSPEQADKIKSIIQEAINANETQWSSTEHFGLRDLDFGATDVVSVTSQVVRGWNHRITVRDSQNICYQITLFQSPEQSINGGPMELTSALSVECPEQLPTCNYKSAIL